LKKQKDLEVWEELKPDADMAALYGRLSNLKRESSILLAGHEPYLIGMVGELISRGG
jgi:phosphohistidine phosphatase SixA